MIRDVAIDRRAPSPRLIEIRTTPDPNRRRFAELFELTPSIARYDVHGRRHSMDAALHCPVRDGPESVLLLPVSVTGFSIVVRRGGSHGMLLLPFAVAVRHIR